jgi:hypothetical protein
VRDVVVRNSGFSSHLQLVDLVPVICLTSSNRLRIEMLQAHMPTKFKTLGSGAPLVAGDNNQVIICDAAERAKLGALRREALEAMNPQQVKAPNGALLDSSANSPSVVQ